MKHMHDMFPLCVALAITLASVEAVTLKGPKAYSAVDHISKSPSYNFENGQTAGMFFFDAMEILGRNESDDASKGASLLELFNRLDLLAETPTDGDAAPVKNDQATGADMMHKLQGLFRRSLHMHRWPPPGPERKSASPTDGEPTGDAGGTGEVKSGAPWARLRRRGLRALGALGPDPSGGPDRGTQIATWFSCMGELAQAPVMLGFVIYEIHEAILFGDDFDAWFLWSKYLDIASKLLNVLRVSISQWVLAADRLVYRSEKVTFKSVFVEITSKAQKCVTNQWEGDLANNGFEPNYLEKCWKAFSGLFQFLFGGTGSVIAASHYRCVETIGNATLAMNAEECNMEIVKFALYGSGILSDLLKVADFRVNPVNRPSLFFSFSAKIVWVVSLSLLAVACPNANNRTIDQLCDAEISESTAWLLDTLTEGFLTFEQCGYNLRPDSRPQSAGHSSRLATAAGVATWFSNGLNYAG